MGGGDDPHVGAGSGDAPPTGMNSPCCSTRSSRVCASSGMSPISSRNSVPPSACSNRPTLRALAPVNAPFSWPNSSLSISSRGIAAMLTGDERAAAALAEIVQRPRHQLLAGAGLAGDQHREVGAHQPGDDPVDLLHRRRAADDRQLLLGQAGSPGATARVPRLRQRALTGGDQLADVEGLGQILEGAALGRAHRGEQRVLRAHHDDRQVRAGSCGCAAAGRGVFSSGSTTSVITTSPSPSAIQRHRVAADAGRLHVVALRARARG